MIDSDYSILINLIRSQKRHKLMLIVIFSCSKANPWKRKSGNAVINTD